MDKQDFKGIIPFKTAEDYNAWRAGTFTKGGEDFPKYNQNILAVLPDEQSQYVETGIEKRVEQLEANAGGGKLYRHYLTIDGEDTINSISYQWKYNFLSSKSTQYTMTDYMTLTRLLLKGMVAQFWKFDMEHHYGLGWIDDDNFYAFTVSGHEVIMSGDMDTMYIDDTVTEA